jgi:transposase
MPAAYSNDLRKKVIEALNQNKYSRNEVSTMFNIDEKTLYNWDQLYKKTGSFLPRKGNQGGHNKTIDDLHRFQNFVENNASLTRAELAEKWGHNVSASAVGRAIKKIGFTFKKNNLVTKKGMKHYVWHSDKK